MDSFESSYTYCISVICTINMTDMISKRDSNELSADLKEKLDEIIEFYKKDKSLEIPETSETMEKLVQLRQVNQVWMSVQWATSDA